MSKLSKFQWREFQKWLRANLPSPVRSEIFFDCELFPKRPVEIISRPLAGRWAGQFSSVNILSDNCLTTGHSNRNLNQLAQKYLLSGIFEIFFDPLFSSSQGRIAEIFPDRLQYPTKGPRKPIFPPNLFGIDCEIKPGEFFSNKGSLSSAEIGQL